MTKKHQGRIAVVTGAAKGIGRAYAERLAAGGATVALVDLEEPAETIRAIEAAGGTAKGYLCDVSSEEAVSAAAAQVLTDHGHVDILVNNAGIYPQSPFEELGYDQWQRVMRINVDSMFLLAKAFLPSMRESGWGRVVNMTSGVTHMVINEPRFAHYVTSKAAVVGLTRALANEYGQYGITVNAIGPSIVDTPGNARQGVTKEVFEATAQVQAIKRVSVAEDMAGTLDFLASEDAGFITGQTVYVDGGMTRQ